jgi:type IV pilus assembly protein PilM
MAKSPSVWGIEVGQTALKALRCSLQDGQVVAEAFDYIEYPKILSQPEAVAEELVSEALAQLLERNDAIREKVCISVPGQSGLAKFFKPPPVEVKKVVDIVRYEARQQIPFDLNDVVWDYQMMPGSMVEEGYALESEVGLFAMKREQAYRQLAPFDAADIEVDIVQMAPLALYNMVAYDRMHERLAADMFDPDSPPTSSVLLSIGTDSSDLIVTNGFRIWQRSMPIGGNHFTRQLTKDLKLTFAKAEHLKRNAREAVDPKLIFQTMRPVFNDMVTEVQRSIGFFRSLDKKAEIAELLVTGNTVKMPGLAAYLGKNLGFEVHVLDRFNRLSGDEVLSIPTFRDNAPTFAVCYGLCLQGLGVSQVHATLVPREILTARMIRAKKPWTLAGLAALLIGMSGHYAFTEKSWATTRQDLWASSLTAVDGMKQYRDSQVSEDETLNTRLKYLDVLGREVSGNAERRLKWLEITRVINQILPVVTYPGGKPPGPKELPLDHRKEIYVTQCDSKHFEDLTEWYSEKVRKRYVDEIRSWARITQKPVPAELLTDPGPTGPGWVFELRCYHYYNSADNIGFEGSNHVRNVMTSAFLSNQVKLPIGKDAAGNDIYDVFTLQEMGIGYPLLLDDNKPLPSMVPNPDFDPSAAGPMGPPPAPGLAAAQPAGANKPGEPAFEPPFLEVLRQDFIFQVVWQEKVLSERLKAREEAAAAAAAGGTVAGDAAATTPAAAAPTAAAPTAAAPTAAAPTAAAPTAAAPAAAAPAVP